MARATPRRLIYMVCFGAEAYRKITALCVSSLRRWGKFEGDVIVVTDGVFKPDPAQNIQTIELPVPADPIEIKLMKAGASAHIDASRYAEIALMDVDMLAVSDINGLFGRGGKVVRGMREYPFNTMLADSCGGRLITLEERAKASRQWGINSGFLCMPGRSFQRIMKRWADDAARDRALIHGWVDQPFFNRLVLRDQIPFEAYRRYWLDIPPMYKPFGGQFELKAATKILHFAWPKKEICLSHMTRVAQALEEGRSRVELDQLIRGLNEEAVAELGNPRRAA